MLEDNLNLKLEPKGEIIENPKTLDELSKDYVPAVSIQVIPSPQQDYSTDLDRVLILKSNIKLPSPRYYEESKLINRGYFAYGKQDAERVIFEVYVSAPSLNHSFPSGQLQTAVALFAMKLNQEGYAIPANAITYSKPVK